ncbi:N-acetylglutamate synthase, mitochondrial isoform X1 [Danio rerio]|uniref:N-acetylglutamate synthase, mitochondrial n=1 Tax=Danio rerio TaxID=7955 RepID=NAGS_DANRE|nr:N-acetylglutamate synthase, mitochondrial isoform X1 [Danio rerio]E7FCP8.1 RecName: Full=N-acetylglutamate synthase, mitochondrial; Contains: RecName: Full=N-acetylglutamate synthase, mature form; Short=NAGS-M; Contains: RecName: Full=N-acetylglutamate synthase, conserved domain form; Short=NAGS-C; Flags: Precursor [Danio rerio]|eukprot:XP_685919.3 N-acetylglutamate synthase, mitochondrial isoform X1 [Danio rerio]
MAKVNSGSSGCRAMVMAGQFWTKPFALSSQRSGPHRRSAAEVNRRMSSSRTAGHGSKTPLWSQQESYNHSSLGERSAWSNRTLIYRDVKAFLREIGGDPREARYWLTHFQRAGSTPAFAVLEVDPSVFDSHEMVQSLAFGLSFLQRMDMKLVVVMGLPAEITEDDHTRSATDSPLARTVMVKHCQALTEALQDNSANVMPFFSSEALLQLQDNPLDGSSSGPSVVVDSALLQWTLDCRVIPLVCPVGRDTTGRSSVLRSIQVTTAISQTLQPLKVIFLNSSGGIRNQNHKVLGLVSLPGDLPALSCAEWLNEVEQKRIGSIAELLNLLPVESSAVLTSANTLLTELFSHKGSGTLFKNGDPIRRYSSLEDIDVDRLLALINKSFEKNLREDYIASLEGRLHSVYLSEGYSAAAIITTEPVNSGTPYLDKFVVSSSKQGQGTGQILWECIRQDFSKLFWRSRTTNRINPWYFKHCDGSFVNGHWIVFWLGLSDIRESYELVEFAKSHPDSFCSLSTTETKPLQQHHGS